MNVFGSPFPLMVSEYPLLQTFWNVEAEACHGHCLISSHLPRQIALRLDLLVVQQPLPGARAWPPLFA